MASPENSDSQVFDLQELSRQAAVELPEPEPKRFKLETLGDLLAEPEPEFAVDSLLKRGDLVVAYGPAKSCKTYAAIDLMALLMRGSGEFAGQFEVKERWRVVLVTNEGRDFLRYRFKAAVEQHDLSPDDINQLRVVRNVCNFYTGEGMDEMTELLLAYGADMVVFDTLFRVTVGADENTGKDMGVALENADRMRSDLGGPCMVFIHHANKAGGMRGFTGIPGAADVILKFDIDRGSGRASMKSDGMKDAPEFDQIQFKTVQVGEPRCRAVEWLEVDSKQPKQDSAALTRGAIIDYLRTECRDQANAATSTEIAKGTTVTNKTVLEHLRRAHNDNSPRTINGVRLIRKRSEAAGRGVDHWYWDSAFEVLE